MLGAAARYDECSPLHRLIWKIFENKQGRSDDAVGREIRKLFLRHELRGANGEKHRKIMFHDLMPKMLASSPKNIPIAAFRKPSSPFRILLEKLGPNVCFASGYEEGTPLHLIAKNGFDDRSMRIQVILAQQLIDAGAFVNSNKLPSYGHSTPLHVACSSSGCINLDLIKVLLDNGGVRCRDSYYARQSVCHTVTHPSPSLCET